AAVHHHDRDVLIALHRNLILHVHLVDGDLAARGRRVRAEGGLRDGFGLAADEEAALLLNRERPGLFRLRQRRHYQECGEEQEERRAILHQVPPESGGMILFAGGPERAALRRMQPSRWVPNSFVIACLLTLVTFGLVIGVAGASPVAAQTYWTKGFWELLE